MRPWIAGLPLLVACAGAPAPASAPDPWPAAPQPIAPAAPERAAPNHLPPDPTPTADPSPALAAEEVRGHSTSMQNPTDGWLVGGVPLPLRGAGFRFNPDKDSARRYGTVELVNALVRGALSVVQAHPGGELTVNDIAMPEGGALEGHASHRNGRDVDVMFYLVDQEGAPFPSKAIPIEPDGGGFDYRDLSVADDDIPVRIDLDRTWAFVAALLANDDAHINRIYVVEHVRSLLLEHAREIAADDRVVERFGQVTCQPKFPHDDHFHIRFYCSADDIAQGCEDTFPIYPWHERHLAQQGVSVRLAKRRPRDKPKLTSVAEAERKARRAFGTLHPEVSAFLQRRKAWVSKPSPGRRYCP